MIHALFIARERSMNAHVTGRMTNCDASAWFTVYVAAASFLSFLFNTWLLTFIELPGTSGT